MSLSVTTCLVSLSVGVSQTILMFIFLVINATEEKRKLRQKARLSHISTELADETELSSNDEYGKLP